VITAEDGNCIFVRELEIPTQLIKMTERNSLKHLKIKINNLKDSLISKNNLEYFSMFINLVIAGVGIYFACIANEIAQTQLDMQRTDTSQQSQLNKLTEIVEELKAERLTSTKTYQITEQLNQSTKTQLKIINQQLGLATRLESKAARNDTIEKNANLHSLFLTFHEIYDFKTSGNAFQLDRVPIQSRAETVNEIKLKLESQLKNKFLHDDKSLNKIWFGFYFYVRDLEFEFDVYHLGSTGTIKNENDHNALAAQFVKKFLSFLNSMLKEEKKFLKYFSDELK